MSQHAHFVALTRAINQSPMTAAEVLLGVAQALHAPDGGRCVADVRSPRGAALRAIAHLAQEETYAARVELRHIATGLKRRERGRTPSPTVALPSDQPHIAYDDETGLLWGYGDTLAECMADAGWHVREAGGGREMATMRYHPAVRAMQDAWERFGPDVAWAVDRDGIAVPA